MTVARCLIFIPISCTGPKHAPKDQRFDFSTKLYAPEHVHVVQIWIVHINALKTHLMHKNVQTNPKNHKNNTTLLLFYLATRNFLKAIRGNGYHFAPKVGAFPTKTIMLVVRSSDLWEAYTQTCPKLDKNFTIACWRRSMIACQLSWISDEFWIY